MRLFIAIGVISVFLMGAVMSFFAFPPMDLEPVPVFGKREVKNVYPRSMVNGQWVLFADAGGRRWEAFIRCLRPLRVGERVEILYAETRGRTILYFGGCQTPSE